MFSHESSFVCTMACQLTIGIIALWTIKLAAELEAEETPKLYNYNIKLKRKYLSMKFNDYVRVDGDPMEVDITVTWLKNITRTSNQMEVLYIVQTPDGNEVTSKSFDLPILCAPPFSYSSWDRNIINIYMFGMTGRNGCPMPVETIGPPSSFSIDLVFDHKLSCQPLHFIMDLYPFGQMESAALLVLEGQVDSLYDC